MGLDEARNQLIAGRIRDNAAAAGLVASRDKCKPNSIAIITYNPQAMYSRIYHLRFGVPATRMNQNIKDVYDTDCVRVGAPAQTPITEAGL